LVFVLSFTSRGDVDPTATFASRYCCIAIVV
jgi:hypothetical protein